MTIMPPIDQTLNDLDLVMEIAGNKSKPRPYLGMSGLGHDCWRKGWMDFHWISIDTFKADTLRNFADGHYSEDLTAARLQAVPGLTLHTHNEDGSQFGFSDLGGHFRGHMDGAIQGIAQAPKTWHVWEHKCTNEKKYRKLDRIKLKDGDKNALALWDFIYYAQAILYLHYSGMTRHYLTVGTSGSRQYTSCRTDENPQEAKNLIDKADLIITSPQPLEKLSNKPDYFQCAWCTHHGSCHGSEAPKPTCRSCYHSTPTMEGTEGDWYCGRHNHALTQVEQSTGCIDHVVIPALLEGFADQVDGGYITDGSIKYRHKETGLEFANGKGNGAYSSIELFLAKDKAILGDPEFDHLRTVFDGEVVG